MITNALPLEAAALARVVADVAGFAARQVVVPEADLVVIAQAVAILRAVEGGRRRMAREQVQRDLADAHRHIPMALRRQRQHREFVRRVPVGGAGVAASSGNSAPGMSRHRNLRKVRARARVDRETRQQHHAVLARETRRSRARRRRRRCVPSWSRSKPDGTPVLDAAQEASTRRRWRRAVLRPREVVSLEVAQRRAVRVEVELLQQQDVGPHALDDLGDRARLRDRRASRDRGAARRRWRD